MDKIVKWLATVTHHEPYTHLTLFIEPSECLWDSGPIHEFRKGCLFSGQLPPPQQLVPGTPGLGDAVSREELGHNHRQYPIYNVHDVADCSLERSQVASSICQKFHLHSRIDGNTTLINSIFPQRCTTKIWFYLFNWWRHLKVAAFFTSSLTWFYAEDKNLQVGEFFIHGEIQKSDIWICFYWQYIPTFCSTGPVQGKHSRFHECLV